MTAPVVQQGQDRCRTCQQEIVWAVTRNGKDMPVNVEPEKDGNIRLTERPGMAPLADVLPVAKRFGRTDLRTSHFTNCPGADRWRRR